MHVKLLFLWIFGLMNTGCFMAECYEIATGTDLAWADHLHNLIDHVMYFIVNYIGFNVINNNMNKE